MYFRNVTSRGFEPAVRDAGLDARGERLSFHSLRHTAASLLLRQGVDVVRVSRFLGHSQVSTTLNVYAHVIEETRGHDLGDLLEAAVRARR